MKIIGHKRQRAYFDRIRKSTYGGHMFILAGPSSIGKKCIAQAFAVALTQGDKEIKWEIPKNLSHYGDILQLRPQIKKSKGITRTQAITVESVRRLRSALHKTHVTAARVLIIDEAQEMTIAAQNALLKIIEEPPEKTFIICITQDVERLLLTIRSRASIVTFGLVHLNDMKKTFPEHLDLAEKSAGKPGYLLQMKSDEAFHEEVVTAQELLGDIKKMTLAQRMQLADEKSQNSEQTIRMLQLWTQRIHTIAHESKKYHILHIAQRIEHAKNLLCTTQTNKKMILENLLINM